MGACEETVLWNSPQLPVTLVQKGIAFLELMVYYKYKWWIVDNCAILGWKKRIFHI